MLPPLFNSRPRLRSLLPCLPACPTLQVERLQELLGELDAIPPRLQRSLEDYKRHEATLDLITAVLADIVSANLQPCVALPAMHAALRLEQALRVWLAALPQCTSVLLLPCSI